MSRFTDEMYATAASSPTGLVTGEPSAPLRQSWNEVHQVARKMAGGLAELGIGPGDAVGILAGQPVEIAPSVQAIWMRGGSVTMLHQPTPRTNLAHWAGETQTVVEMIKARAVIISAPFEPVAPILAEKGITAVSVADLQEGPDAAPLETAEEDIALQQLTSGSTGAPKAVRITHGNFYTNTHAMIDAAHYDFDTDVMVSWLPLFHDMGMVGFLTTPMQVGCESVNVTPLDFLQSPLLWADLITKYRGTITSAPNFAWALLARRLRQAPNDYCDLSSLRVAMSGAEPIDPDTMLDLLEAGERFGLKPEALAPAYGMAETTLAISMAVDEGMTIDEVDADLLEAMFSAVPAQKGANTRRLVTLGPLVPNLEGRVVDNEGNELRTRGVGTIEVRGPAVSPGYVTIDGEKPTQDSEGWLNTGDIGYFTENGHIVVCGRAKDVIIMGGRNIYPTDIERAAATVSGVRAGASVAVRIDAGDRRESFAVAVESKAHDDPEEVSRIQHEVVHAVFAEVGVRPRTVAVLAPGTVPKTPSGKLRRSNSVNLVGL
ncbi:fatty acyl-AMP ligase [Hoyosella altamirensis]|uniref:Fatty-acyl-CoA synthase n=1 Tax=Hoyosella altamirensis TaxID=616997 RepID=A0A839RH65_9ACTN|nr:fatty acyl-AMP ligase [Hoyosella altamirensis]MBB3035955.1 fatty-acyl-CoA synthase [Hoyosella altamirensis]